MHSSRMRTACMLTVSPSMLCARGCTWFWGVYLVQGGVPGLGGVPGPGGTWSQGVYLVPGECTWSRGVPGPREVYLVQGVPGPEGCVPGPGECTWSRGCTWSWGVHLVQGAPGPGVYLVWGVYLVPGGVPGLGVYLVRYSPLWTESQTPVKT